MSFYQRLLERMEATPGVQSAAHPEELIANNRLVSEDYFRTLGIPLREGRAFSSHDGAEAPPVAVINESMARRFWPGESPVGKRFQFVSKPWVQIIGVVGDVHQTALDLDPAPEIYRPFTQDSQTWLAPRALVIRTRGEPSAFAPVLRQQFQALDSSVPIYGLDSMDALLEKSVASRRLEVWLVGAFGLVALLLASIGIYGVVAYVVAQRGHEIGLRMALGATRADVVGMMLRKGLTPVLIGLAIGVALALALSRFLSSQLYHVKATDALTFAAVPLLLILIAGCAAYFPSRRAARIDPMQALRQD
jgi:predicted permease